MLRNGKFFNLQSKIKNSLLLRGEDEKNFLPKDQRPVASTPGAKLKSFMRPTTLSKALNTRNSQPLAITMQSRTPAPADSNAPLSAYVTKNARFTRLSFIHLQTTTLRSLSILERTNSGQRSIRRSANSTRAGILPNCKMISPVSIASCAGWNLPNPHNLECGFTASRLGGWARCRMDGEDQRLQGLLGEVKILEQVTDLGCILAHVRTGIGATISLRVNPLASQE